MNPISPVFRTFTALLIAAALAGCALPGSIQPNTSADDLLRKLGKPTETRANPAGGEYWDYVYGPAGTETWRFGIDGSRVVRSVEQLLTDQRLYRVVPGVTTEAQVRELLGKPSTINRYAAGSAWDWRVDLRPNLGYYVVQFGPNGIATSVSVMIDISTDSSDRGDK